MKQYKDFEIRFSSPNQVEWHTDLTGDGNADFELPFSEREIIDFRYSAQLAVWKIGRTRVKKSHEIERLKEFGKELFLALPEGCRSSYRQALSAIYYRMEGTGIRLRLTLGDRKLLGLPWEFLFDPEDNKFLGLNTNTLITRYVDLPRPRTLPPLSRPVRILGVVSDPDDLPPIDWGGEREQIERALAPLKNEDVIDLRWLDSSAGHRCASFEEFHKELRIFDPHILHFIGHGDFDTGQDEGVLYFMQEDGQSEGVEGSRIATLTDSRSLQLVFLNSCLSAGPSQLDTTSAVANALVRSGISTVVGMQFEITDEVALDLAGKFYEVFVRTGYVDVALQEARELIGVVKNNPIEWATPVLYMRAKDGKLFDITPSVKSDLEERMKVIESEEPSEAQEGPTEDAQVSFSEVEFVNRREELEELCDFRNTPRFTLITAPAGFGKSRLLEQIQTRFSDSDEFLCILIKEQTLSDPHVRTNPKRFLSLLAQELGCEFAEEKIENQVRELSRYIVQLSKGRGKIYLLIDSIERLGGEDCTAEWILENDFFMHLTRILGYAGKELRVLLAGRYIDRVLWKQANFYMRSLSAFDEDVVQDLAGKYVEQETGKPWDDETLRVFSREITVLSGGHPAAILSLLNHFREDGFAIDLNKEYGSFSTKNCKKLFESYVAPEVRKIVQRLDPRVQDALNVICVFRYFNADVLDILIQRGKLSEFERGSDLLRALTATGLIDSPSDKDEPLYADKIVRRILSARLRFRNPSLYHEINDIAIEIYDSWAKHEMPPYEPASSDEKAPEPFPLSDKGQARIILESLFHHIQTKSTKKEHEPGLKEMETRLLDQIQQLQTALVKFEDIIAHLQVKYVEDKELRYSLNNLFEQGDKEILRIINTCTDKQ